MAQARAPLAREPLEDPADRLAQAGQVLDVHLRAPPQPLDGPGLVQLEHQVVGPQAGDVLAGVPSFQRIVELVGQEDGLQPGGVPDLAIPFGAVVLVECPVVQLADVLGSDLVVGEAVEGPGDLDQPGVLDRVVDALEVSGQVLRPGPRIEIGADLGRRHPRGVGELGIVMVPEDLIEVACGGPVGVDVRMGVEDRPAGHLARTVPARPGRPPRSCWEQSS